MQSLQPSIKREGRGDMKGGVDGRGVSLSRCSFIVHVQQESWEKVTTVKSRGRWSNASGPPCSSSHPLPAPCHSRPVSQGVGTVGKTPVSCSSRPDTTAAHKDEDYRCSHSSPCPRSFSAAVLVISAPDNERPLFSLLLANDEGSRLLSPVDCPESDTQNATTEHIHDR